MMCTVTISPGGRTLISYSYLIYARALLEYVIFILWVHSVSKMLPSVKFTEYKVLTFIFNWQAVCLQDWVE